MTAPSDNPTNVPSDQATASDVGLPTHLLNKLKIKIPGYEMLEEISRGGQATVYRATELTSGLTVAIKLLHSGPYADAHSRARLQREIAALKALNHPNIVCVIEAGQTPTGLDYLVMNYIEGRTLDALWRDPKYAAKVAPEPPARLALFKSICQTTQVAHRRGITHRDLSPSNILIDADGQPHILDFGLASTAFDDLISPGGNKPTLTGQFIGKLAYASPEQARGQREAIDPRTDVYALGVILYQILTGGAYPYTVAGNLVEVLNNIVNSKPLPPSSVVGGKRKDPRSKQVDRQRVNRTIEAIVLKALQKAPDDRYQSAGELAADVANYLDGKPTSAELQSRGLVSNVVRSRRWMATITAMLVLAIVAVTVWMVRRPGQPIAKNFLSASFIGASRPATWPANPSAVSDPSKKATQPPATQSANTETLSADDSNFSQPFATASATSAGLGWKIITSQTLVVPTDVAGVSYQWPRGLVNRLIADIPTNIKQESVRIDTPGYVVIVSPPRYFTQHQSTFRNGGWQQLKDLLMTRPGQVAVDYPIFGKYCKFGETIEFTQDGRPPLPRIIIDRPLQNPSDSANAGHAVNVSPLLIENSQWVEGPGFGFLHNNPGNHSTAVVTSVIGRNVVLRMASGKADRPPQLRDWHLQVADDGHLICTQIDSVSNTGNEAIQNIDFSGDIVGDTLRLHGTLTLPIRGHPTNETVVMKYDGTGAATTQPQPPFEVQAGSRWAGTYTTMAGRKIDAKVTVVSVDHDIVKINMQTQSFTDLMEIKKIDSQLMIVSISDALHPPGDPKHWECWDVNVKGTVTADTWSMAGTFTDSSKTTGMVNYNFHPDGPQNDPEVAATQPAAAVTNPPAEAIPPNSDAFSSVEPLTWTALTIGQPSGNGKITSASPGLSGYYLAQPANGTNFRLKFNRDLTIYDAAPPNYIMRHADLIDSQGWIKTNDSYDVTIDGGGGTYHMIVFTKSFKAGQSVSAQGLLLLPGKP